MLPWNNKTFLVAWPPDAEPVSLIDQTKKLVASWDS
jgi:hypothetical protein